MSEPIIKLDSNGKATVISYNVPEPTSYTGRNVIELEFDEDIFTDLAKSVPEGRQADLSTDDVEAAIEAAEETGVMDEAVFPNVAIRRVTPGVFNPNTVRLRR